MKRLVFLLIWATISTPAWAVTPNFLPRQVIALYDSREEEMPRFTRTHRFLEMPLNYLGFDVRYQDIVDPVPQFDDSVVAVVIWFTLPTVVPDPNAYLAWLHQAIDRDIKVVVLGNLGIDDTFRQAPGGMKQVNRFLNRLGVEESNAWITLTYESDITYKHPVMMGFERKLGPVLPPYQEARKIDKSAQSYLKLKRPSNPEFESDIVVTNRAGGYLAGEYLFYYNQNLDTQQWWINPFYFLRQALSLEREYPVPDPSSLMGRRIFYSHIDGDGWNNVTEVEPYRQSGLFSSQVIGKEILEAYTDFPFNVGVIVSDLVQGCYGLKQSEDIARKIFAMPNVEASSHTHSHPLFWRYFEDGDVMKEEALIELYPAKPKSGSWLGWFGKKQASSWDDTAAPSPQPTDEASQKRLTSLNETLKKYFGLPRSYACEPFDLDRETKKAIEFTGKLLPPGKKVTLYQWSGDTSPFEAAIHKTREAGVLNMNGGDSRLDAEFPSYTWVSPVGLKIGKERQIYSSNSNENTYTYLWTNRYYGFRYLKETVENTESPIRVKPFNLYFHMFSGEKAASLAAIKENLDFARRLPLIHLSASQYASVAEGFYTAKLQALGTHEWKVLDRGALQTIRFDRASDLMVDFSKSQGVLGQHPYQGSLYILLDPSAAEPVVVLTSAEMGSLPAAETPYLFASTWVVRQVMEKTPESLVFEAEGWGNGDIVWKMPQAGKYEVILEKDKKELSRHKKNVNSTGLLSISVNQAPDGPQRMIVKVKRAGS